MKKFILPLSILGAFMFSALISNDVYEKKVFGKKLNHSEKVFQKSSDDLNNYRPRFENYLDSLENNAKVDLLDKAIPLEKAISKSIGEITETRNYISSTQKKYWISRDMIASRDSAVDVFSVEVAFYKSLVDSVGDLVPKSNM